MPLLSTNAPAPQDNLTVSTTAVSLTVPDHGVTHALIYVGGAPIRFKANGSAPTATAGMYVAAGNYIDWTDPNRDYSAMINNLQLIRDTTAAGDATVEIAYFKS